MYRKGNDQYCSIFCEFCRALQKLAVALLVVATAAPALGQTYSVTGVAANDVLNMRAGIDRIRNVGDSPVVGEIPPNATNVLTTGVSVVLNGVMWREVVYDGIRAWVSAKYLKRVDSSPEVPASLTCGGTEPFWGVEIEAGDSSFIDPAQKDPISLEFLHMLPGLGRSNLWAFYLGTTDENVSLTVVTEYTESCSDGMSDLIYDYEVILFGLQPIGSPAKGCCSINR